MSICRILFSWRRAVLSIVFLFAYLGTESVSMAAGEKYSEQGHALSKALVVELVKEKICVDVKACAEMLQMYGEDGDRIHLHIYSQTNRSFVSAVSRYLIESGLKVTGGVPITLLAFPGSHAQYMGIKAAFGSKEYAIKLEINK